jgi:hypothetical protein
MSNDDRPRVAGVPFDGAGDDRDDRDDGWVEPNGSAGGGRAGKPVGHVPGIYDQPQATYVRPTRVPLRRSSIVMAGAIVLVAIVIAGGLVAAAEGKRDSGGESELSAAATLTSTSTRPPGSTTTTAATLPDTGSGSGSGSGTAPATSPTTTRPAAFPAAAPAASPAPPTPRATANPGFDPYQPKNVPTGVSASLTGCNWQPTGGGELQSAGTLTSHTTAARTWTLTMVWLQNSRELARQVGSLSLAPGETKTWGLVTASPAAPLDLACALEIS